MSFIKPLQKLFLAFLSLYIFPYFHKQVLIPDYIAKIEGSIISKLLIYALDIPSKIHLKKFFLLPILIKLEKYVFVFTLCQEFMNQPDHCPRRLLQITE